MKIIFDLKKKYCWINQQILMVLTSAKDHRCHQSPNQSHVCFWEGDFQCVFDVFMVDIRAPEGQQCEWLQTIVLNDHDHKKNNWTIIIVPDRIRPHIISICGGPSYASGYSSLNNVTFEMTVNRQN